jgi:hypothetical protein
VAGYSGTPLWKKLGVAPGHRVALVRPPHGFAKLLGPLLDGVSLVGPRARADVAVVFVLSRAELARDFTRVAARLEPAGGLWVAWPKKASGVATDVTENVARDVGLPTGYVDNKVCAIDDVWSALRFVLRKENRPA